LQTSDNVLFEDKSGELNAATINQLVERLTNGTITALAPSRHNTLSFRKNQSPTINEPPVSTSTMPLLGWSGSIRRSISRRSSISSILARRNSKPVAKEAEEASSPAQSSNPARRRGGIQHTHDVVIDLEKNGDSSNFVVREVGEHFEKVFLLTYPTFTTPELFLTKLLQRYEIPSHIDQKLKNHIQVQICQVLFHWMETFPHDFTPQMVGKLEKFIDMALQEDKDSDLAQYKRNQKNKELGISQRENTVSGSKNNHCLCCFAWRAISSKHPNSSQCLFLFFAAPFLPPADDARNQSPRSKVLCQHLPQLLYGR
jgi:hypothetical protein